jgi:coenzyme F420-reducing hydrogenase beta subunit
MIIIKNKEMCCGCEACANVCPGKCIRMDLDRDGFRYPAIDTEQCMNCHRCENVCPNCNKIRNMLGRKSRYVQIIKCHVNDETIRASSSSGGIFSLLAESIIMRGGTVFAVEKKSTTDLEHVCIQHISEIPRLRRSKYFQSHINETFKKVKEKLRTSDPVLFVGTPCQVAGLYSYLGKDFNNLYTCDLKCHGVPSPESFFKYCESVERHTGSKVSDYYRDKSKGWNPVVFTTKMENGELISKEAYQDEFNIAFITAMNLRPSCYKCKFAYVPRMGDITLSDNFIDAHNASEEDKFKGLSMLALNSPKGKQLFKWSRDEMTYSMHELKGRALFGWMSGCKTYSGYRTEFMNRYANEDFLTLIHEINSRTASRKIKLGAFIKKLYSEFNKYLHRYMYW